MDAEVPELLLSPRILLGPGPSMADPRVLRAMSTPLLGQFDPDFTTLMQEVMALSRVVFQTQNPFTFPVSGTGRGGPGGGHRVLHRARRSRRRRRVRPLRSAVRRDRRATRRQGHVGA